MGRPYKDLTGITTDTGIYIKGLADCKGGAGVHKKWICVCPVCGKDFVAQSNHIIGDKIKSCFDCAIRKYEDLSGRKFGQLTVIKRVEDNGTGPRYLCKCDCGNECTAQGKHLVFGSKLSCGCLTSSMESKTQAILESNKIKFETQKTFEGCKNVLKLKFDFFIPELNTCIELQGQQHYVSVEFFGGEKQLQYIQNNDAIKEDFCKEHGIKLLQIRFDEDLQTIINEEIVWPLRKQMG